MTDLNQQPTGEQLKAEAMALVEEHANPVWKDFMYDLTLQVAKDKARFTSDDVFARASLIPNAPVTHENRAYGPVISKAARNKVCRKVMEFIPSVRPNLHCQPIQVWESLIHHGI